MMSLAIKIRLYATIAALYQFSCRLTTPERCYSWLSASSQLPCWTVLFTGKANAQVSWFYLVMLRL